MAIMLHKFMIPRMSTFPLALDSRPLPLWTMMLIRWNVEQESEMVLIRR